MKRVLLIFMLISMLITFSACEKHEYIDTLNLDTLEKNINDLTYEKDDKTLPLFYNMTSASKEEIKNVYKINTEYTNKILIKHSALSSKSNMYIVLEAKEGRKEKLKKDIDSYMLSYEKMWKKLNKREYNLVTNRSFLEDGNYLIYVISYDNNLVMETVKNTFTKRIK